MLMEKIRRGVLQVSTETGERWVAPSLGERLRLLWTFRNFHFLSEEVLNPKEQRLMRRLCRESRYVKSNGHAGAAGAVIGTLELRALAVAKKVPRPTLAQAQKSSA